MDGRARLITVFKPGDEHSEGAGFESRVELRIFLSTYNWTQLVQQKKHLVNLITNMKLQLPNITYTLFAGSPKMGGNWRMQFSPAHSSRGGP